MPELPELEAHAERLDRQFAGAVLDQFVPLRFTVLKTARPAPNDAAGTPLRSVTRRGKYLLVRFDAVTLVIHLMQGGRLLVDTKQSAKPRNGQARLTFRPRDGHPVPALLLTEAGTERRAGVWCVSGDPLEQVPLERLGPDALDVSAEDLATDFATHNMRIHGYLRDQARIAGLGRLLANEVCHRARVSPFAMTAAMGHEGVERVRLAIHECVDEALAVERTRDDMSSSADRPAVVHGRVGHACPDCGDTIRSVSYSSYTVAYCPTCQTDGRVLADNTTSRFLR
ncbi:MAG: hypothetical protein RI958_47 [Actinomycetota bacterium]|jgi:formamidopyrimidine-DNA glycosylase